MKSIIEKQDLIRYAVFFVLQMLVGHFMQWHFFFILNIIFVGIEAFKKRYHSFIFIPILMMLSTAIGITCDLGARNIIKMF